MIGCICCHGPTDRNGNCYICDSEEILKMSDDYGDALGKPGHAVKNIATLVPTKPDKELAEEYKQKLIEAHEPLLQLLTEIQIAGFQSQVQCGMNALGKMQITQLNIIKVY